MIRLSEESLRLASTFRAYRNHIDIYTEDNDKDKEFYKVLFNRLLKNEIIINDVTPLGCKDNVIKRCETEPNNGRKKIFIVDGDITLIHGKNVPSLENLFVLDGYCIENFLFDKETILHFIYINCAIRSKEDIEQQLDFDNWLNLYTSKFIDLFIHFALINFYGGKFTLFNANKYHIKEGDNIVFKENLVEDDIANLKAAILEIVNLENYTSKYGELRYQWSDSINNLLTIVSGKDYLIPILLLETKKFKKSNALPTLEEIKFSLVQYNNLDRLAKLKEVIESL